MIILAKKVGHLLRWYLDSKSGSVKIVCVFGKK